MDLPTPEQSAAAARIAGHPVPATELTAATETLAEVLALAERLDELDLDGVAPLFAAPPAGGR